MGMSDDVSVGLLVILVAFRILSGLFFSRFTHRFFFPTDLWVCMDLLIYSLHIDRSNQPRWCGPRTVCKLPFLFSFPIAHTPGPPNSMGLE